MDRFRLCTHFGRIPLTLWKASGRLWQTNLVYPWLLLAHGNYSRSSFLAG